MKYIECLKELELINLKSNFINDFEKTISKRLLKLFKKTNKINSTASLIKVLINELEYESELYFFWVETFQSIINPDSDKFIDRKQCTETQ